MIARLFAFLVVGVAGSAFAADSATSPELSRSISCMLDVLKATPGVKNPKLNDTAQGLCLSYDPDEQSRWEQPTHFCLQGSRSAVHGPFLFWGLLPGIASDEAPLDFHVTDAVTHNWQVKCGVEAIAITG